jgi:uncharacterized membrane protein YdjX (TVP38/TMEM64 family)
MNAPKLPLPGRAVLLAALLLLALGCWALFQLDAGWADPGRWREPLSRWSGWSNWSNWQEAAPWTFRLAFVALFALLSALAIPGCAPLALLAGSAFGGWAGTLIVGLASTLGALMSFLGARHFGRSRLDARMGDRIRRLDAVVTRHGALALFWLRLVPMVPFPVLNPLLGLSRLSVAGFFWPSLAGLTLGSVPYVWAGQSLGEVLRGGHLDWMPLAAAALGLIVMTVAARCRLRRAAPEPLS